MKHLYFKLNVALCLFALIGCGRENNNDDPLLMETRTVTELSANELGTTCRELTSRVQATIDRQTVLDVTCKINGLAGDSEEQCESRIAECQAQRPPSLGFDCDDTVFSNRCGDQVVADIATCQGVLFRSVSDLEGDLNALTCTSAGMDLDDAFEEEFDAIEDGPGCSRDLIRCAGF